MARFTGKRAVVAGGGRGIGEATAVTLAPPELSVCALVSLRAALGPELGTV